MALRHEHQPLLKTTFVHTATSSSCAAALQQTATLPMALTAALVLTPVMSCDNSVTSSISINMHTRMLAFLLAHNHHQLRVTVNDVARQSSVDVSSRSSLYV